MNSEKRELTDRLRITFTDVMHNICTSSDDKFEKNEYLI